MARGQSPYQGRYTVPIADFSPIAQGGRDFAAGLQSALGDWGKFKGELNELEASIGGKLEANPELMKSLQEDEDHRKTIENLQKGKVNLKELRALSGTIAGRTAEQDRMIREEMVKLTRDRAVREDELGKANQKYKLLQQDYAHDHATYVHEKMKTIKGLEEKNEFFKKEMNAKLKQLGLVGAEADEFMDTGEQRRALLEASVKKAEVGAKMSALDLWNAERAKNVTQWQDRLRGGPLGSANYLNDIQDMQLDLLKGKITEQNIANTLANAPRSIRSILEEQNKFTESIKKTSVSWKGKMIPFSDYMDLHFANDEDENLYPLKGEGAANTPQGRLWAQYTTSVLDTNERLGEAEAIFDTGEGESPDIGISKQDTKETALEKTHYAIQDLEEQIQEAERKITDRTLPIAETEAAQDVVKELRKKLRLLEQSSYAPNAHEKALIKFKEQRESPSEYKKRVQGVRN